LESISKIKIALVTSGQPSANPRLVKEAITLEDRGFDVTVIYCPLSPWADAYDLELFKHYSTIKWLKAGAHPTNQKFTYLYCRLRQKIFQTIYKLAGNHWNAGLRSITLFSQELESAAKKIKAHLYIGHNLGALPAVVKAAKLHDAKACFDFEDFHRGEDAEQSLHWKKTQETEDKYVPFLSRATAASPLIADAYKALYPSLGVTIINNCFTKKYSVGFNDQLPAKPLRLFWFSQTVGKLRGIETVIQAMGILPKGSVSLSLLGNCSKEMSAYFSAIISANNVDGQVQFLNAVAEQELVSIASGHHIGIASEIPHIINREYCLTNKLFIYLLAGSALVCTNTKAQSLFNKTYTDTGLVYVYNKAERLAQILERYINQPELLLNHRKKAYELGQTTLNWEQEQTFFLNYIKQLFSSN
jgi:glycosyltransferase involved in cell wall biosynthesis